MSKSSYGVGNVTFNITYSKEAGLDFESSPLEPRIGLVKLTCSPERESVLRRKPTSETIDPLAWPCPQ